MLRYLTSVSTISQLPLGGYQTHGIMAMDGDRIVDEIEDVSLDGETVERWVRALNHGKASLLHFREVLEDLMAQE